MFELLPLASFPGPLKKNDFSNRPGNEVSLPPDSDLKLVKLVKRLGINLE